MKPYNDRTPRNGSEPRTNALMIVAIVTLVTFCWAVFVVMAIIS